MKLVAQLAASMPEKLLVRLVSLAYRRYEPEIRRLDDVCGRGGTMVDVGGWYGPWTRRLRHRAGQVVVIEPTPLHEVLRRALAPAGGGIAAGASAGGGEAELWVPDGDTGVRGVSSLHRRDIHGKSIKVPLVRLDDLGLSQVTFIKIDVDGHEVAGLRGGEAALKQAQPRLLIE